MTITDVPLLVLAGGKGTRLSHLSKVTPKYLQPVTQELTFADVHLRWICKQGFRKVLLSVGHLGQQIKMYCGNGSKYNLSIEYIEDGPCCLGTGGAVRNVLKFPFEMLAVTYGDTLLDFDILGFFENFQNSEMPAAMTLLRNLSNEHQNNADLKSGLAIYDKISPLPEWEFIDYGFLVFRRKAIIGFSDKIPLDLTEPLAHLSRASRLLGFEVYKKFIEIGSPEALERFRRSFISEVLN